MFIKQFISTFKKVRLEYRIYLQEQREKKTASQLIMVHQGFGKYSTTQMARLVERKLFNKSRRR